MTKENQIIKLFIFRSLGELQLKVGSGANNHDAKSGEALKLPQNVVHEISQISVALNKQRKANKKDAQFLQSFMPLEVFLCSFIKKKLYI
jgi:hypothetical protein